MAGPGELLAQAGQNLGQGIQEYAKIKQADAAATGQIEAYLGQAQQPGATPISPQLQPLLDKFTSGNAKLNDKMALLGAFQTQQTLRQQANTNLMAGYDVNSAAIRNDALNRMYGAGGATGMQPQGQPPQQPQPGAPIQGNGAQGMPGAGQPGQGLQQAGINMGALMQQYVRNYGALPPPDIVSRFQEYQMNQQTPAGIVFNGSDRDPKTGLPTQDNWQRVLRKGDGSIIMGEKLDPIPTGTPPPDTVLNPRAGFQPYPQNQGWQPPTYGKPLPDAIKNATNTQEAVTQAMADGQTLQVQGTNLAQLTQAANAYVQANPMGNRTNSFMGTDKGLALRALVWGDSSGETMQGAAGNITGALAAQAKMGRVSTVEFKALTNSVPDPTDPDTTIMNKVAFMPVINKFLADRNTQYTKALQTGKNTPAEAAQIAREAVPFPETPDFNKPFTQGSGRPGSPAGAPPPGGPQAPTPVAASVGDSQALSWARLHPADPRAVKILQLNGGQ